MHNARDFYREELGEVLSQGLLILIYDIFYIRSELLMKLEQPSLIGKLADEFWSVLLKATL